MQLPTDLVLLTRVIIAMSEGLGARLDPDFRLLAFAEPDLRRFWLQSYSPDKLGPKMVQGLLDLADMSLDLLQGLCRLLGQVEHGEFVMRSRHEGLEEALAELNRMANRLAVNILVAALIIGLGLLMLVDGNSGRVGFLAPAS